MLKFLTLGLRLRYIIPATAGAGYYGAKKKYDELKSSMPEMPDFVKNLMDLGKESMGSIDFDKFAASLNESSQTFNEWLDEANQAIKNRVENSAPSKPPEKPNVVKLVTAVNKSSSDPPPQPPPEKNKPEEIDSLLQELARERKDNSRLRKENRELRSAVRVSSSASTNRKLKKSLIELYSEVLDELSGYDSTYKVQDNLPKVVVVGDQSAGKTSVLEMIIGARIFPRGSSRMVTQTPIQVTLCEGQYHVAQFNDSNRLYDLTKEKDLADLRQEIQDRMSAAVPEGESVSNQVISFTIRGPGIKRMVLVDLPGIINAYTSRIAPNTRESIKSMALQYISNPNAIILCIQDGAVDAERSILNELVGEVDKKGRRTIVVLTKTDIAEKRYTNPNDIKRILDGELFEMKALGYFAVIAGKDGESRDIQAIRDYEEEYFLNSPLTKSGILNPSQSTTRNLSAKVSECFWGMVKESVAQQADAYKANQLNLEAKWNHMFPHSRKLTRDELFSIARNEILDDVVKLSCLSTKHWDQLISKQLWERARDHIIQKIYIPAIHDPTRYGAQVDMDLQQWVESLELPKLAIGVAQESVRGQFENLLDHKGPFEKKKRNNDDDHVIFKQLKKAVIHDALDRHQWKDQALDRLKFVQSEALSKGMTLTQENWNKSIDFLQNALSDLIQSTSQEMTKLTGYGFTERWLKWKSTTEEQYTNQTIVEELKKLRGPQLTESDLITVKKNLESRGIETSDERIRNVWEPYRRYSSLLDEVDRAKFCKRLYYFYENDIESGTDCSHVIFFWRIKHMLESTNNSLRNQILESECRSIEDKIIEVLDDYSEDNSKKAKLLSGERVELAEEIRRVTQIQKKLEEFIEALSQEDRNDQ